MTEGADTKGRGEFELKRWDLYKKEERLKKLTHNG